MFRECVLGDLVNELTVGHVGSMVNEYEGSGIPFLRSLNILPYRIITDDIRYISSAFHKQLKKSALKPGDVVIVRTGKPGTCAVIPDWLEEANCSDLVIVRCGPELRSHYLAYWVNSLASHHIGSSLVGAVQQHFNVGAAREMPILLPDIREQDAILAVLGALDDKIELNRRMNETLEALAQAIFRDWFVDFGPVRRKLEGATDPVAILGGLIPDPAKAAPLAALFPDSFGEESLPKGWRTESIYNLASVTYGAPFASSRFNSDGRGRPLIRIRDLPNHGSNVFTDEVHKKEFIIEPGTIVVGMDGEFRARIWHGSRSLMNQRVCAFLPIEERDRAFTYFSIIPQLRAHEQSAIGTTVIHLGKKEIDTFSAIQPGRELLGAFSKVAEPMLALNVQNGVQNRTLAETRDYLLPKLMSGEVRVRDTESVAQERIGSKDAAELGNVIAFPTDLFGRPFLNPEQEIERDAVMVASIVRTFRDGDTVVGNVKVQKGCYFIRRRVGISVQSFEKQAAGPYDQNLNHEGGRGEAISRNWIRRSSRATAGGKYIEGNVPDNNITEIDDLLKHYQLAEAVDWVVRHFASKTRDELECLATVDFAMRSVAERQMSISLESIKADIASDPVWKPKLAKPHFSNAKILEAIRFLESLFGG